VIQSEKDTLPVEVFPVSDSPQAKVEVFSSIVDPSVSEVPDDNFPLLCADPGSDRFVVSDTSGVLPIQTLALVSNRNAEASIQSGALVWVPLRILLNFVQLQLVVSLVLTY
jgi:hypothetical protein